MKSFLSIILALGVAHGQLSAVEIDDAIATIQAIQPEGVGNAEASAAWKSLTEDGGGDAILPLLESMEAASPLARNWLRSAVDVIVEQEQAAGNALPVPTLGQFLLDTRQSPQARRQAFDLIAKLEPETAAKMVPGFLNDPSNSLRRDAVAGLIEKAEASNAAGAALLYQQAIAAARDVDQVESLAKKLEEIGQPVDLPRHFGFLMYWKLAAPFDNTERGGFDTPYPPETTLDSSATYEGKDGKEVVWVDYSTTDKFGMVDFNSVFEPLKEVVGYATTTFDSPIAGPAEIRIGCKNAWKVWLNGELIFGRDEYHRGMRIDQYQLPVQLKAGPNAILVKACQDAQTKSWTAEWQFQLRVCDSTGTAILATGRKPTPVKAELDRRGRPIQPDAE